MPDDKTATVAFGSLTFSPEYGLIQAGRLVSLPPKAQHLLAVLIEARGMTVSKDEIVARVWSADPASDDSVYQTISGLRRILVSLGEPDALQSVHAKGYRLAVLVRELSPVRAEPSYDSHCQMATELMSVLSGPNLSTARRLLQQATAMSPENPQAHQLLVYLELAVGLRYMEVPTVSYGRARHAARQLLVADLKSALGMATLGLCCAVLDRSRSEARALIANAEVMPGGRLASVMLCKCWTLALADDLQGAIEALEAGLAQEPEARRVYASYGLMLYLNGRFHVAIEFLEVRTAELTLFSSAWGVLSLAHLAVGNVDRALHFGLMAARSDDSCPTIKTSYVSALIAAGREQEARQLLAEILADPVGVSPSQIAPIYHALHDDITFRAKLRQAEIERCPYFPIILKDPRLKTRLTAG